MVGRPTAVEWETLQKYRALDEHGRDVVDYLLESEYQRVTYAVKKQKPRMVRIDWYILPASAGTGNFLETETPDEILVKECSEAEDADYVIPISGDSMEPTYHSGDNVFVEKCDSVEIGEVGIFVVNGDAYIKELGDRCLISHNENYKPIKLRSDDSVYCCGRVIGVVEQ
jgi:phage repressor protein C with HTH and peptisase S24 domain